jgi:hypothetical protein
MVFLLVAIGAGYTAGQLRASIVEKPDNQNRAFVAAGVAGTALIGAALVWITRPSYGDIEERVAILMGEAEDPDAPSPPDEPAADGTLICTLVPERSRITGARTDDVEFDWQADGCVNERTQYGLVSGEWTRVLVPSNEAAVSISTYDPETRTYRTDRYLLGRTEMDAAREARSEYNPPACGVTDAARVLGEQQSALIAMLPDRPNERLVYSCESKRAGGVGGALGAAFDEELGTGN